MASVTEKILTPRSPMKNGEAADTPQGGLICDLAAVLFRDLGVCRASDYEHPIELPQFRHL